MRLVTFIPSLAALGPEGAGENFPRIGIVNNGQLLDVPQAWKRLGKGTVPRSFLALAAILDGGEGAMGHLHQLESAALKQAELWIPETSVKLLAPLPRPLSLRDCMAFPEHLLQATRGAADLLYPPIGQLDRGLAKIFGRGFLSVPALFHKLPAYYKGNPGSVVGHNSDVIWPNYCTHFDYELEFGIYIGKRGKNIPEGDAKSHIAGYTIFNDFSARDVQLREMKLRLGPAKGKDFDTGNVMGPYLVTPDEVPDPYNLSMRAEVDGELWTDTTSAGMAFSFEEIIAYISRSETLFPGDFIAGGTVGGGCGLEHGRWLKGGQHIVLKVQHLGELANTIHRPEA